MDLFTAMGVSASGLSAQRTRINLIASNLANANTTRTPQGGPYRRRDPVFEAVPVVSNFDVALDDALASEARGVVVAAVREDSAPPRMVYAPDHPDADANGYVAMPNVNVVEEMVNMMTASRSHEAGVTALAALRIMAQRALQIGG